MPGRCSTVSAAPHPSSKDATGVQRAVCGVSPSPLRMIPLRAAPSSKIDGISRQEGVASRCPQQQRLLLPQMSSSFKSKTKGCCAANCFGGCNSFSDFQFWTFFDFWWALATPWFRDLGQDAMLCSSGGHGRRQGCPVARRGGGESPSRRSQVLASTTCLTRGVRVFMCVSAARAHVDPPPPSPAAICPCRHNKR